MVNVRMLGIASALAILLPTAAYALPNLWPDPNDPSTLVVEGGAAQYANVSDITLFDPPQQRVGDPNSTVVPERLVEGHTTFAVITLQSHAVNDTGTIDLTAALDCAFETGVDYWGPGIPYRVHSTTAQCLENATLVAIPSPVPSAGMDVHFAPDGNFVRYQTPTGEVGYETEYTFVMDGATRYAWAIQPLQTPFVDHGAMKSLYAALPEDKLREMGVHDFRLLDARRLPDFR